MTTPVVITGFEGWPNTPTTNGTGLCASAVGSMSVSTNQAHSGSRSLRINPTATTGYVRLKTATVGTRIAVGRCYVYFASIPAGQTLRTILFDMPSGSGAVGVNGSGKWYANIAGGSAQTDSVGPVTGQWYRIDIRVNSSANPVTIEWQIDGVSKNTASNAIAAEDIAGYFLGATANTTGDYYIDDVVISETSGDFPIGPGGTQYLGPDSDGTHNAGTNTMEDQAGNDIGAVAAYDKINSVPPDATTYIRQATAGTGNYAEVNLNDISDSHSAIIGVHARLAYTSATTSTNKGATIISKDGFSTQTDIWGNPTTRADMSDGATNNLYYKSVIVAGAVDDTTVNALKIRMGYSDDVTPNPYWVDVWAEVAYSTSSGPQTYNKSVSGSLTFSGTKLTNTSKPLGGSLYFSGAKLARISKSFTGSLTFIGNRASTFVKILSGSLSFSGTKSVKVNKSLSGVLTFTGNVIKRTTKNLTGSISFSSTLTRLKTFVVILSGTLSFSGSSSRKIFKSLSGLLNTTGGLRRLTTKAFSGGLSFFGSLSHARLITVYLSGSLEFLGDMSRRIDKQLIGSLSFSGSVRKLISKSLSGALSFVKSLIAELVVIIVPETPTPMERTCCCFPESRCCGIEIEERLTEFSVEDRHKVVQNELRILTIGE